jgi:hypothetical protein
VARRMWLRAGLVFLAVTQVAAGVWGVMVPRSFYDDAPWVAMLPPYNEHLVRDVGAYNLALGVVLAAAAVIMERRLAATAVAGYLTFTVPHFVFHVTHLAGYSRADALAQTATLAVAVVIPVALLILAWRPGGDAQPPDGAGPLSSPARRRPSAARRP